MFILEVKRTLVFINVIVTTNKQYSCLLLRRRYVKRIEKVISLFGKNADILLCVLRSVNTSLYSKIQGIYSIHGTAASFDFWPIRSLQLPDSVRR